MIEVREVTKGWDEFVESSPQGTIFSTTTWCDLIGQPYHIWGVYKGKELIGGAANFDTPAPITPFQGILVKQERKYTTTMSLHNEVANALMPYLPDEFYNHYEYLDIRPFKWAGNWDVNVRYTYVVYPGIPEKMWDELEKKTRYAINSNTVGMKVPRITEFISLYKHTFERKGLQPTASDDIVEKVYSNLDSHLYISLDGEAGVLMIRDSKRSYYILGASKGEGGSSYILWKALLWEGEYWGEVDMVGCNDQKIGLFKRGFGGELKSYYGVRRK